jgi:YD repeat-containing protein
VTQTTDVRVADFPLPDWQPGEPRWLALFDVQALGEAGQGLQDGGHTRFLQPLTVTLDLRERIGWLDAYLLHFADPAGQVRQFVPSEFDRESGVLTTALQTFSGAGAAGQNPFPTDGSSFTFKTWPAADLYSGGLSYAVQINAPTGAGGLGPSLSLNYSSRSLDGMMGVVQSPDVGVGWSLGGVAQIVREINTEWDCPNGSCRVNWRFDNKFTLMLGSTSYQLVWGGETGGNGCRYETEERSALRVRRYNALCGGGSPANETGEYWMVTTPEGTQYRLGYNPDAEQVVPMWFYDPADCTLERCSRTPDRHGYAGKTANLVAYRWRVDRVQDTHQNTMRYGYAEIRQTTGGAPIAYDRASHLAWIEYGGNERTGAPMRYRVEVGLEERRDGTGNWHDDGPPSYRQHGFNLWESWRVHSIRVYANGALIREYVLRYETPTLEHPGIEWGQLERPEITILAAVQEYGRGGEALPAVTFGYAYFDQADDEWDPEDGGLLGSKLRYPRLAQVSNGYGGWVAFGYERLMSDHVNSYRVTEQWQGDGLGHTAHTAYAYGEPCFAGHNSPCSRDQPVNFALLGHDWAKESVYDYGGAALVETTHYFHCQREQALGREYRAEVRTPGVAAPLQVVTSTWNVVTGSLGSTTVYTTELRASETCQGDACRGAQYEYDTYGNVVVERSLGDTHVSGNERTARRAFAANTAAWIVSRPISETLSDAAGRPVARQYFYYDGQAYGGPPLVGDLTRVDVWQLGGPYTTISEYDAYGNVTAQTDALGRRATTAYDTTYHQFPTQYYGVNAPADPAGSGLPGQVYRAWGPNGPATATATRYDPFGRVLGVARPGDSLALPTVTYEYTPLAEQVFFEDFETTCAPYSRPQGWDTFLTQIGCVQGNAKDGTWSMAADGPWGEYGQAGSVESKTHFPLQPDASYRVRLALKGQGTVTFILNNGEAALTFNAAGDWQVVEGFFRTGGSTTSGWFYLGLPAPRGSNAVQLDQIEIARVSGLRVTAGQRELSGCAGCVHSAVQYTDGLGRVVQTRSEIAGGWSVASQEYDALGRAVRGYVPQAGTGSGYTPPSGDFTATAYDALGRAVRVTNPDGTYAESRYQGWTTTAIDANRHQRVSTGDAYGQLVQVEEYTGTVGSGLSLYATTRYAYDALGNLTVVTDTNGVTTTMVYDDLGRKVEMFDPDMGHWSYNYDLLGNLITQADALSQTIVFQYDELNRLVSKSTSGQVLAQYRYDESGHGYGEGQRTSLLYPGGSAAYSYDERGRVITETRTFYLSTGVQVNAPIPYTTTTYDAADRVRLMTYPDGEVVTQTYDGGMLPATLTSSLGDPFVRGTTYNALGQIERLDLGNALRVDYAYYPARESNNRLRQILIPGLLDLTYAYDAVGNVQTITDTVNGGQVQFFTYDPLDRLTGARTTGGGEGQYDESYTYNEIGNLTSKNGIAYRYPDQPGQPRPHAVTDLSDGSHFDYDANGNMVLRVEISGTQTTTYTQGFDVENRLTVVTATMPVSQTVTRFVYDGDGARVAQVTPEGTTIYVGEYYEEFLPGIEMASGGAEEQGSREIWLVATLPTGQYEICPYTGQAPGRQSPAPGKRGVTALVGEPMPSPLLWGGTMQVSTGGDFDIHIIEAHPGCNGCARLALVSPWGEYLLSGGDVYGMQGSTDSRYFSAGSYIALAFYHYQADCSTTCASSHNPVRSDDPSEQLVVINALGTDHWTVEFDDMDIHSVQRELRVEVVRTNTLTPPTWADSGPACTASTNRTLTWNTVSGWWYRVQRASDAGFTQNVTSADVLASGPTASYTFGGHGTGTYYYRVQCRGGNNADPTGWITAVGGHDLSAPVTSHSLAGTPGDNGWYVSAVQVTLSAAQVGCGAAGATYYRVDGGGWQVYGGPFTVDSNGTHSVQYYSNDGFGNTETTRSASFNIDCVPPTGSVTVNSGAAWTNSRSVTLALPAADATSGVSQMRFYNDGEGWSAWEPFAATKSWMLRDADGARTVSAQFRDAAGNQSAVASDGIGLDRTAPTNPSITINSNASWTNSRSVTLNLSAYDVHSGVAQMRFQNDGEGWSAWIPYATTASWPLRDEDGTRTVAAQFRDAVGNESAVAADAIALDRQPPTGAIQINANALLTNRRTVTLTLGVSDQGASGLGQMRFQNDGEGWSAWEPYAATRSWTLRDADGPRTVTVEISDNAGNTATFADTIGLDRVPPPLTITLPLAGQIVGALPLSVKGQSEVSATVEACALESGASRRQEGLPTAGFTLRIDALVLAANTLVITATDLAQNATVVTRTVFYDPVGPAIVAPGHPRLLLRHGQRAGQCDQHAHHAGRAGRDDRRRGHCRRLRLHPHHPARRDGAPRRGRGLRRGRQSRRGGVAVPG